MTTTCPICDGELVEKDQYGEIQECMLCATRFSRIPTSRVQILIDEMIKNESTK